MTSTLTFAPALRQLPGANAEEIWREKHLPPPLINEAGHAVRLPPVTFAPYNVATNQWIDQ